MCGRAKLEGDISEIKIAFRVRPDYPTPNFAPSWNVAPTDNLPIVRYDPKVGHRTLDLMRWGLIPYWAKDIKIGFSTINAMAETVDTKPVFREAFKQRRCLVPIEAFYEWRKVGPKELHDHYHRAERAVRANPQPNARDPPARDLGAMARGRRSRRGDAQDDAGAVSVKADDPVAGQ
jgi:putative SOS response-associated peptidase YedK